MRKMKRGRDEEMKKIQASLTRAEKKILQWTDTAVSLANRGHRLRCGGLS
jgi:hypothetical protein